MFVVAALYKFVTLEDFRELRAPLQAVCDANEIRGTLLLAHEGINGTVAGSRDGIDALLRYLRGDSRLADLEVKESSADEQPFLRMKVRLKKEIVTLGVPEADPNVVTGEYVDASQWNELIQQPDVLVVDTRNRYETEIGTFEGAVDPETDSFREFPEYVKANLDPTRHRKVAMFCTGGIRCEKATSMMKQLGFDDVYQLRGGILKYLEEVPEEQSLWRGDCYVFDRRVAVGHGLAETDYSMCFSCGWPLRPEDLEHPQYEEGVSCGRCSAALTDEQRERFRERQRQLRLARERGEKHLGEVSAESVSATD